MALGPRRTCSILPRSKYDVFTILPGCNHAWCPSLSRTRGDWVHMWVCGRSKAANTSKTSHWGPRRRVRRPRLSHAGLGRGGLH